MATSDDILAASTVGSSVGGTPLGLVYMQLKIITLILKQGFGITDDDFTLLQVPAPTLNPNTPSSVTPQ